MRTNFDVKYLLLVISCCVLWVMPSFAEEDTTHHPTVIIYTTKGNITLELYPDRAPLTVENFLHYVKDGFYDGTVFHRVVNNFMIQGGGFTPDLELKETRKPIVNESKGGLNNDRYTIAMARKGHPDSATSQFFINTRINSALDAQRGNPGYTVFGFVTEGKRVVKAIEKSKTHIVGRFKNVPVEPILIERIEVITAADPAS